MDIEAMDVHNFEGAGIVILYNGSRSMRLVIPCESSEAPPYMYFRDSVSKESFLRRDVSADSFSEGLNWISRGQINAARADADKQSNHGNVGLPPNF